MSFNVLLSDGLRKSLSILKHKDKTTYLAVKKKIVQIADSDIISFQHFKNLRGNLKNFKRVHIGSYVLIFRITDDIIIFEDFTHHDKIYQK